MTTTSIIQKKCDSICNMLIKYSYDLNSVYSKITENISTIESSGLFF